MAAGLKFRNPQPSSSPALTCPVCLSPQNPVSEPVQSLICMHYCCRVRTELDEMWPVLVSYRGSDTVLFVLQLCWQEYLTSRIEQNLVMNCNCPITDCQAQPTSRFFLEILTDKDTIAKVMPLLRCYDNQSSRSCFDEALCSAVLSVREHVAQRLRGVLLQPDVVHQPSGLRSDPLQGEHGQHGDLLQVWLVLLLQLQLPRGLTRTHTSVFNGCPCRPLVHT